MSSIKTTEIEGDVSIGRHVGVGGNAHVQGNAVVKKNLIVDGWLEAKNVKSANKGLFTTVEKLREAYPRPHDGWWAFVGRSLPAPIYVADGGAWVATGENGETLQWIVSNIIATYLNCRVTLTQQRLMLRVSRMM